MNRTKSSLVVFAVLAWLTIAPLAASAEWFADVYVGAAITPKQDITNESINGGVLVAELRDVEFDTSVSFGGRVGYWFETPPFRGTNLNIGLAVDAFHFQPDIDRQIVTVTIPGAGFSGLLEPVDVSVTAISFDLMLRWQLLPSGEFPKGQLQPYFSVGPTIFFAEAEDSTNLDPPNQSESDVTVGVKVGAGLAFHILKNVAFFAEYRFTFFSPEFEFRDVTPPATIERLEADISTHHFVAGIGYRF